MRSKMMSCLLYVVMYLSSSLVINCANNFCSEICLSGTCCEKELGHFLCCPVKNGVCCPDGNTCCPQGSQCNADGSCNIGNSGLLHYSHQMSTTTTNSPSPKLTTQTPLVENGGEKISGICPLSETRCAAPSGTSGCCPFENAVCCDDYSHCCPAGFKCDSHNASCVENESPEQVSYPTIPSNHFFDRNCPVSSTSCLRSETCCQVTDDEQACCPLKHAECCSDGQHCCPKGTKCNSESNGCDRIGVVNPFLFHAMLNRTFKDVRPKKSNIICPDRKSTCVDGSTCCEMQDHSYGCCPTPNATCCLDGKHCCPKGYTCYEDSCMMNTTPIMPLREQPQTVPQLIEVNLCEDGLTKCTIDSNCCQKIAGGAWSCCPMMQAKP